MIVTLLLVACTDRSEPDARPSEGWISVSAGTRVTCAVNADGSVVCWGDNARREDDTGWENLGEDLPPDLPAARAVTLEVSLAGDPTSGAACAVLQDDTVRCWGAARVQPSAAHRFADFQLNAEGYCGARYEAPDVDGHLIMSEVIDELDPRAPEWGLQCVVTTGSHSSYVYPVEGAVFRASGTVICVSRPDGWTKCRDWRSSGQYGVIPADPFQFAAPMADSACGLGFDGAIRCFEFAAPDDLSTVLLPPDDRGPYSDLCLSNDWGWGCAIDRDGHPQCFGQTDHPRWPWTIPTPDDTELRSLSCGAHHVCGLTRQGRVRCFGNDTYGQASPPQE